MLSSRPDLIAEPVAESLHPPDYSSNNHIDSLPTELKLALLTWTGIGSPRALWALSSTSRELRLLSEALRWKHLPIYPDDEDRIKELVEHIAPKYGRHVKLCRFYSTVNYNALSDALRCLDYLTTLRHLDLSLLRDYSIGGRALHLFGSLWSHYRPVMMRLEALTLAGGHPDVGIPGEWLRLIEGGQLKTIRLRHSFHFGPPYPTTDWTTLTSLENLRLNYFSHTVIEGLTLSPEIRLKHLDIRDCNDFDMESLRVFLQHLHPSLISLTFLMPHPDRAPRISSPESDEAMKLPFLQSLSIQLWDIGGSNELCKFASSPLRTLRLLLLTEEEPHAVRLALDDHSKTLETLQISFRSYDNGTRRWKECKPRCLPTWVDEIREICSARKVDFREGNWIADEWEEHFTKWM